MIFKDIIGLMYLITGTEFMFILQKNKLNPIHLPKSSNKSIDCVGATLIILGLLWILL